MDDIIPFGVYERISSNGSTVYNDYGFKLVTEKIDIPSGSIINKITIRPYGNYPSACDSTNKYDYACGTKGIFKINLDRKPTINVWLFPISMSLARTNLSSEKSLTL